jgi:hypothetical protein
LLPQAVPQADLGSFVPQAEPKISLAVIIDTSFTDLLLFLF